MSSPIAKEKKTWLNRVLISLHKKKSHNTRIEILAEHIGDLIKPLITNDKPLFCLDVGCGDMSLAGSIERRVPETQWRCMDLYELPEEYKKLPEWAKYCQFNGTDIPFEDNKFDLTIVCDVLHHVKGEEFFKLFKEILRVSKKVLIKDHFEYGIYSRLLLKAMDFVGNWGYGVSVPDKYFTEDEFANILLKVGASEIERKKNIELYSHLVFLNRILKKEWQFFSLIKKVENDLST